VWRARKAVAVSLLHAIPKPTRSPKEPKRLRRRAWMRKKAPRRLKRAGSDREYLAWLHTQLCILAPLYPLHQCSGGLQASHLRSMTGMGLKEPDCHAIPMCRALHEAWEQHRGPFRGLSKLSRFAMFMQWIRDTQVAYAADRERRG